MQGVRKDWPVEPPPRMCVLEDYRGADPRWCPGCGDHAVLNAVQRLARDKQLPPEKVVVVSGIGCSSRFPHYMGTYGFHGLHGRAFPVACGVRSRRPDLDVFMVTGDGDCCAIGTAHWIHAIRYNMKLTVLLLDNNVYGLTKNQTSPTAQTGQRSNTHPRGSTLPPLNPIAVTLGIANASFVAQTIDWNPPHLYNTIRAAYEHPGTAFVRVLQRCPHFTSHVFDEALHDPGKVLLMTDESGIPMEPAHAARFPNKFDHNPSDLAEARFLAERTDLYPIGLFYRNVNASRYDEVTSQGIAKPRAEKLAAVEHAIEKFAI